MVCKWIFQINMLLWALLLAACAPNHPIENTHQAFPPSPLLPLNVVLTRPMLPVVHQADHEALQEFNKSPGRRHLLMNCVWQDGLANMVKMMIPGTKISFLGQGKNPLEAVGPSVQVAVDSLGQVNFHLDGYCAIDLARSRGWTHLIVPYALQYFWDKDEESLVLETPVAIIDILEKRIVWQGIIDSKKTSEKILGQDDARRPALTPYEETTYRFVLQLAQVMKRQIVSGPYSKHELATPCQDPPPLLE